MLGKQLARNDKLKEAVIPVKTGGKYFNRESFFNIKTGKTEDREWSEGPTNSFCEGYLREFSTPSEAFRSNFDLIKWERPGKEATN